MFVRKLRLPVVPHPSSNVPLYPHQAAIWDAWDDASTFLLRAKTGTGKTRAAMLPVLKRNQWGLAIYPTNELVKDQVRAVEQFATAEGCRPLVWTPGLWQAGDRAERYSNASHILVPIDGALLDEWQVALHCRSRGETLRRLLDPDKPKIVFTNPDILFLVLGLKYHAEPFAALGRYETLIVDEFHLYQGVELAHMLIMIALARGFGIFRRVVLLSATPDPEVGELLHRAVNPAVIDSALAEDSLSSAADGIAAGAQVSNWRTAMHTVQVTPVQVSSEDPVEILLSLIIQLRQDLEHLRSVSADDRYLPAVVIVNSVLDAIRLEDRLVQSGFPRDSLAVIRGLSNRAIRNTRSKLLALGTSAIEVGVDFHCDYLLFEGYEAASFLQRFGRVGRDRPGKAVVLVPPSVFQGMSNLPSQVERDTFERKIQAWYPSSSSRSWFVTSEEGLITARALAEGVITMVARDGQARPDSVARLRERVEAILADHAQRLGCQAQNLQAGSAFKRFAAGKAGTRWIGAYCQLNRFRTSLPSVTVHDFVEEGRRNDWQLGEYDIDLPTLLRRAVGLTWNQKLTILTIRGLGKYHRVHASEVFGDEDCGLILETRDYPHLLLYQDDACTPVSDLMRRENHIFTVVPRAGVEHALDWRIPVFRSGTYIIAFDGAALLIRALWRREIERAD